MTHSKPSIYEKHQKNAHVAGFTIVELLVIIVVIAILAAITIVSYSAITNNANQKTTDTDAQTIAVALNKYKSEKGAYPNSVNDLETQQQTRSTITYSYNATNGTYCVTATIANTSSYVVSGNATPKQGVCPGQGGSTLVCPSGYIVVPGNSTFNTTDFCVMKYEAKNVGGVATSQASGVPWGTITQINAISTASAACSSCHLITDNEWLTIAHNVLNVPSNWTGGAVGSGSMYVGNNDGSPSGPLAASTDNDGYSGTGNVAPSTQRRTLTLSNGEVIWDFAGNVSEWTNQTVQGANSQPGVSGASFNTYEWNAPNLVTGNFATSFPSYGTSAAANWTSAQGIGKLNAGNGITTLYAAIRGGGASSASFGGVLSLGLANPPDYYIASIGFRVVR